jgi:hypothetical protein
MIAFLVVFVQWIRSDERGARSSDSRAEEELRAYNVRLARMAESDRS